MSNECSTVVWKRDFGNATRKVIAARLADHADDEGRGIWPSVDRVAAQCNSSCRTVQRTLAAFVTEGILKVVSEGGRGPGSTTRYDFDMAVIRSLPLAIAPESRGDGRRRRRAMKRVLKKNGPKASLPFDPSGKVGRGNFQTSAGKSGCEREVLHRHHA